MKVIVFGATGFIGSSVAEAFARAGHITYGTSRSESSRQGLVAQEIIPIICDPYSKEGLEAWGRVAETADAGEFSPPATSSRRAMSMAYMVIATRAEASDRLHICQGRRTSPLPRSPLQKDHFESPCGSTQADIHLHRRTVVVDERARWSRHVDRRATAADGRQLERRLEAGR